jgi:hypothetical protein
MVPPNSGTNQLRLSRPPLLTDESTAEEAEEPLRDKAPARAPKTTTATKDASNRASQEVGRGGQTPATRAIISRGLALRPRRPAAPSQSEGDHEAQDAKRKVNEVVRHAIAVRE